MIYQFVKDPVTRHRVGVVTATPYVTNSGNTLVVISWSKCHTFLDRYDAKVAMAIAKGRAESYYNWLTDQTKQPSIPRLHSDVVPVVMHLYNRAEKYYKEAIDVMIIEHVHAYHDINEHEMWRREDENKIGG